MSNEWLGPARLLFAGSLFFPLVYNVTKKVLMRCTGYKLTNGDICLISEKITCSIQAVVAVCVGVIIVSQIKDIMADTHWLTKSYAWFGLPYFAHDVWAIYQTFYWNSDLSVNVGPMWGRVAVFLRRRCVMLVHHLVLPVLLFPVVVCWRRDMGDFFVGACYTIEVMVPFLSLTHVLDQLHQKDTKLYFVNGLCTLATFFCARIMVFPYLYWRYAAHAGIGLLEVPVSIPIKCNLGCLAILLPQLHWFRLMLRRTFKHLKHEQ